MSLTARTSSTRRSERARSELDVDRVARTPTLPRGRRALLRRERSRSHDRALRAARAPAAARPCGRAAERRRSRSRRGAARRRSPCARESASISLELCAHREAQPTPGRVECRPRARRDSGRRARRPRSASLRGHRRRDRRAACPARGRRRRRPGPVDAATARTTASSLNGSRSSKLPPPRASTIDVDFRMRRERAERSDDRARGALSLHARLADDDLHSREAVADRRARDRRVRQRPRR